MLDHTWSKTQAWFGIVVGVLLMLEFVTPEPWIVTALMLATGWLGCLIVE